MIDYTLVSMPAMLRDWIEVDKYMNREHQLLTDIADSLYNVGTSVVDRFTDEYKELYDKYGKTYFDKVLDDMSALDGQLTDFDKAHELEADYLDRIGDADFYEDYYDPYKEPSDGYGVYNYRNGQENSYTYAENYDEALKYAKWDFTHKNYIDVVRIIDNATGEIVDEFDSLDSIGEGCSPRRKSKKKKIVTQGCSSKEGCGSKRKVTREAYSSLFYNYFLGDDVTDEVMSTCNSLGGRYLNLAHEIEKTDVRISYYPETNEFCQLVTTFSPNSSLSYSAIEQLKEVMDSLYPASSYGHTSEFESYKRESDDLDLTPSQKKYRRMSSEELLDYYDSSIIHLSDHYDNTWKLINELIREEILRRLG